MDILFWKQQANLVAGTTLRNPSQKACNSMALHTGEEYAAIMENRRKLSDTLHIAITQWTFAHQTHSDHIFKVTKEHQGKGAICESDSIQVCDALYTKEKGIALGVFHADCVPVLLYDPIHGIIAAIHSGWQGTIKEITAKTISHLQQVEHVDPKQLHAYIGPSIAFSSFEVGQDVIDRIHNIHFDITNFIQKKQNGKYLMDNSGLNYQMLIHAGVPSQQIYVDKHDTFQQDMHFFSYRRKKDVGRHVSFILKR